MSQGNTRFQGTIDTPALFRSSFGTNARSANGETIISIPMTEPTPNMEDGTTAPDTTIDDGTSDQTHAQTHSAAGLTTTPAEFETYKPLIPGVRFSRPPGISREQYPKYNDNKTMGWASGICVVGILGSAVAASLGSDGVFGDGTTATNATATASATADIAHQNNANEPGGKGAGGCYDWEKGC